ncbi:murein biosynthesis integral membrane protein MurJ [Alkalilimnicola sp. S0819]|uniref:murein biosynthesis integral membrane protein MurJ n=1 Tax=Alkalilimnicola sp. S0819 TaxID=2613922 RepID=UPI0012623925|nr:murein biosynthesis integral membrane protein MurJ [Alkalilimnicola sp. S0819]KAB7623144.1 murein biosynthesis integral membrane protein MurJ [Alkalilimnicola sp. S0819]MPQ16988.1 murein biosynthesis integral membrane protein MurJ [Alkalilimnicola sp. S0819]
MLRSLFTFGSWTLLSRVLGLVRDVVIATFFGAGAATDAFFVAFKIPNFGRRLFAEGAFSQAFVPVLSEYRLHRSLEEVRALIARASGTLGLVLLALTLIGVLGAQGVMALFAPGWLADDPTKFAMAVDMLRLTFPYLLLISLVACAGAVMNTYGHFGMPAFAPVLLNLCLIAAALWLQPYFQQPIYALAFAVFVAGVLQLLIQLPVLRRLGVLSWPRWGWKDSGVRRVLRLMGPAVFGSSVAQINLLMDTVLASFLITGSITWLYVSDRLMEFPLGIFGVALGTVILPRLSGEHSSARPAQFSATLDWALRLTVLIALPAAVGLIMLAGPILTTLFQYKAFLAADVYAARLSLFAYAAGLFAFILVKVLAPGYFARQDTRTPVRFAAFSFLLNMVLSALAVYRLHDTAYGHVGLASATVVAAGANAWMLFRGLRATGVYQPRDGWGLYAGRILLAVAAMAIVLYWPARELHSWLLADVWARVGRLLLWVSAGVVVYGAVLWLSGLRPGSLRAPAAHGRGASKPL